MDSCVDQVRANLIDPILWEMWVMVGQMRWHQYGLVKERTLDNQNVSQSHQS